MYLYHPTETEPFYEVKFEAEFSANQLTLLYLGEVKHIHDDIASEEWSLNDATQIVRDAIETRLIECLKFGK
ncbi:unnamed protein product [Orchesella dallaii]|uniref:Uncharacterized protein n=1 Tax=Orchesella dallaii TaxID=48710 RepID=A0ABP1RK40_9HEXA